MSVWSSDLDISSATSGGVCSFFCFCVSFGPLPGGSLMSPTKCLDILKLKTKNCFFFFFFLLSLSRALSTSHTLL